MREIFLTEIRATISGGKLIVAFLLMTTAFLISLGMMNQEYEKRLDNYSMSISLPAKELFIDRTFYWELDNGNIESTGSWTLPIPKIKRPDPMIFFARGFDMEMRQGIDFFRTWPIVDINKQPEQEKNLLHLIFPAPDLLFMIKLVVSLLAMLFAFDIICAERERGYAEAPARHRRTLAARSSRANTSAASSRSSSLSARLSSSTCWR